MNQNTTIEISRDLSNRLEIMKRQKGFRNKTELLEYILSSREKYIIKLKSLLQPKEETTEG